MEEGLAVGSHRPQSMLGENLSVPPGAHLHPALEKVDESRPTGDSTQSHHFSRVMQTFMSVFGVCPRSTWKSPDKPAPSVSFG